MVRALFIFIFLFISEYSYSQNFLPPDSDLFKNDTINDSKITANQAVGVLRISMEIRQPIETTVSDDMKYLVGIVVDVESREMEQSDVVLKEAKITVKAEPSANYTVLLDDQSVNSNKSLKMSLADKQDKRTLSDSGSDSFQVSGVFVDDEITEDNKLPSKSITVLYDSV